MHKSVYLGEVAINDTPSRTGARETCDVSLCFLEMSPGYGSAQFVSWLQKQRHSHMFSSSFCHPLGGVSSRFLHEWEGKRRFSVILLGSL